MARIGPCGTCVFFAPDLDGGDGEDMGKCIRYAPRPAINLADDSGNLLFTDWPVVYRDWGCGEHEYLNR
jgi:hypothetical protein